MIRPDQSARGVLDPADHRIRITGSGSPDHRIGKHWSSGGRHFCRRNRYCHDYTLQYSRRIEISLKKFAVRGSLSFIWVEETKIRNFAPSLTAVASCSMAIRPREAIARLSRARDVHCAASG